MIALCPHCRGEHLLGKRKPGELIDCSCGESFSAPARKPFSAEIIRCAACAGSIIPGSTECRYCGNTHKKISTSRYCSRCMAFLEESARYCNHCGCSASHSSSVPETSELLCPIHAVALRGVPLGDWHAEECPECLGLWIRDEAFPRIVEHKISAVDEVGEPVKANFPGKVEYRKCPHCIQLMDRYNYERVSGIIVDRCKSHGVWLDHHELHAIVEFIKSGGKLKTAKFESEELAWRQLQKLRAERNANKRDCSDHRFSSIESLVASEIIRKLP